MNGRKSFRCGSCGLRTWLVWKGWYVAGEVWECQSCRHVNEVVDTLETARPVLTSGVRTLAEGAPVEDEAEVREDVEP